jgi:single-strand DNA-binding protein
MNALNSVLLEGNLTRNPELSYTTKGVEVCSFSIATNRFYRSGEEAVEEVNYFDIQTWGMLAITCSDTLTKGRGVRVVGRLKQDRWETEDGPRSRIYIVAEHVEFKPVWNGNGKAHAAEEREDVVS